MAEVFGVVASAFAVAELAGKFGVSIVKMKKLWDEVQDVPEDIDQLIRQLEILRPVLAQMEAAFVQQQPQVCNDGAANLSLQYCQQAVDDLEALAVDMQDQITKAKRSRRNITKFKVSFKKEAIRSYQKRIEFALQLISISQGTYVFAAVKAQQMFLTQCPQPSVSDTTTDTSPSESGETLDEPASYCGVPLISRRRRKMKPEPIPWRQASFLGNYVYRTSSHPRYEGAQVCQARVQLPWWISGRAWDFQAYRASTGWKLSLQPWITRPNDAPIFKYIENGSWPNVLKLLKENEASLQDQDLKGMTLIHKALKFGRLQIAENLVDLGLSLKKANSANPNALTHTLRYGGVNLSSVALDSWRFVISSGVLDEAIQDSFIPREHYPNFTSNFSRFLISSGMVDKVIQDSFMLKEQYPCDAERYRPLEVWLWRIPGLLHIVAGADLTDYYRLPLEARFAPLNWRDIRPRMLLEDLHHAPSVHPADFRAKAMSLFKNEYASLKAFAGQYLYTAADFDSAHAEHKDWRELARWIFTDITLEELSRRYTYNVIKTDESPFLEGMMYTLRYGQSRKESARDRRERMRRLTMGMHSWLEDVKLSGVDLVEYGRREMDLYSTCEYRLTRWEGLSFGPGWEEETSDYGPRLVSFTTGPQPEDWVLIWDPATDEFAGEFWELIENPPLYIPGAWVDDE